MTDVRPDETSAGGPASEAGKPTSEPAPEPARPGGAWWYALGTERRGPVSEPVVHDLVGSGVIRADTLVWREGMAEWAAAARMPELAPRFGGGLVSQPATAPPPGGGAPPTMRGTAPQPAPNDGVIEAVIPYRNGAALAAYYLGVFSLIPALGVLLGVLALVLGAMGLAAARRNPGAHGRVHAIVGILLAGLSLVVHLALVVLLVLAR